MTQTQVLYKEMIHSVILMITQEKVKMQTQISTIRTQELYKVISILDFQEINLKMDFQEISLKIIFTTLTCNQ